MRLKNYLYSQITISFFPIFLSLYFITSLVFLVKIASLTSVIKISFFELLTLYAYTIPNILFFTLPVSFFIALVVTLAKLSNEYELIVVTSFGLNPLKIVKILLPVTFFVSLLLLILSVGLVPKCKILTKDMINFKKKEANFNIKASEFGQKFGDWLIYIDEKVNEKEYKNIKLFKVDEKSEQFIISKKANLINQEGELSFVLENGKSFLINDEEFNQVEYKKMIMNDSVTKQKKEEFTNVFDYWSEKFKINDDKDKFAFSVLTSIFPLISLFFIVAFGYHNPRYEKNRAVAYSILLIVVFYLVSNSLTRSIELYAIAIIPIIWVVSGFFLYTKKVKQIY